MERIVFQAERAESDNGLSLLRFRYVIDDQAEIVIPREWWEKLGAPDVLEVSVRADPE